VVEVRILTAALNVLVPVVTTNVEAVVEAAVADDAEAATPAPAFSSDATLPCPPDCVSEDPENGSTSVTTKDDEDALRALPASPRIFIPSTSDIACISPKPSKLKSEPEITPSSAVAERVDNPKNTRASKLCFIRISSKL